jgi:hypothetical protein
MISVYKQVDYFQKFLEYFGFCGMAKKAESSLFDLKSGISVFLYILWNSPKKNFFFH